MKHFKEDKESTLNHLWVSGEFRDVKKFDQSFYLRKIVEGETFNKLYRFLNTKFKDKSLSIDTTDPLHVKKWKEGQEILLPLTSTTLDKDTEVDLKKAFRMKKFDYYITFLNTKGYKIPYEKIGTQETPWYDFETPYKNQAEVLTAGRFKVLSKVTEGEGSKKVTYIELKAVSQTKEDMKEILKNILDKRSDYLVSWRDRHGDVYTNDYANYSRNKHRVNLFQKEIDDEKELERLRKLLPVTINDFVEISLKIFKYKNIRADYDNKTMLDYYLHGCAECIPNFEMSLSVENLYTYRNQIYEYLTNLDENELKAFLKAEKVLPAEAGYDPIYDDTGALKQDQYGFLFIRNFKEYYEDVFKYNFKYFSDIKDQIEVLEKKLK